MFGKVGSSGAMLALLVSVTSVSAKPSKIASCCVEKTRCCGTAKACCDQPEKAACCKSGTACCDRTQCCGTPNKAAACSVTGQLRTLCCATKAAPMPPCC